MSDQECDLTLERLKSQDADLRACDTEVAPPQLSCIRELRYITALIMGRVLALVGILLALCGSARAACEDGRCREYPRDPAVMRAFTLAVPCPATGTVGGRCPGFIRDHFMPLCAGGADAVSNLWWEDAARAAEKDRRELQLCHRLRVIERHDDDPALRQRAMALYLRDVQAMGGDEATAAVQRAFQP